MILFNSPRNEVNVFLILILGVKIMTLRKDEQTLKSDMDSIGNTKLVKVTGNPGLWSSKLR